MYKYTLKLYKNTSENNEIEKNISNEKIVSGISRTILDVLQPTIELAGIKVNVYNYCYIDELQRYYYITNITAAPNGVYTLSLKVDVLMTYKEDILNSYGLITKNKNFNPYVNDYEVEPRYNLEKHEFQNNFDFTNGDFILVTVRG